MHPSAVIADLRVADIDRARWFFQDFLGLNVESMNLGWVARYQSADGRAVVQLVTRDASAPIDADLSVPVGDQIHQLWAMAQRYGLDIVHPLTTEPWGVTRFFVRTPDGIVVNLVSHSDQTAPEYPAAPTPARPPAGEVWHFSQDPTITEFAPHVARTARQDDPYVWAVAADRAPDYWFPRQMPRAVAWRTPDCDQQMADRLLGVGVDRVHVIEYPSLNELANTNLYAYRFDAAQFVPFGDPPHAVVADHPVTALGPPLVIEDLLAQHAAAGIELRITDNLFAWWNQVIQTDLGWSGIRLKNSPHYRELA